MRFRLIPWLLSAVLLCGVFQVAVAVPPFGTYEGAPFSPTITVLEANADRVRLHFEMENLPGGNINFSQRLPGLWENMNSSFVDGHLLPRFAIFVALPNTGNPTAVVQEWNSVSYTATSINLGENTPGQPRVIVGSVGIMNGVRVVPVTIKPILYTNNAAACSVMTSATISIEIDDQQGTNPVTNPRTAFSRPWQKIFQATVTNWESIPNIHVGAASHILMIAPDSYISALANFIQWKEQRGIKVTVVPKSSIGSNPTAEQVRARIISEVDASSPRIDYVILVGDETQLPAYYTYTADLATRFSTGSFGQPYPGNYTNENFFDAFEGSDVFPDVFLGRWVVNTATEVLNVAAHEIVHERDTFSADSARFERATVSADYTEASQRTTKRRVAHQLADHGFTYVDSIWGDGSGAQLMVNAVTEGRTFVNYRGSGWNNMWWGIQFYISHIAQCNNPRKLPIITGIGCGVAKFDSQDSDCFGEMWMLSGTPNQPKGAAGFIGPSWNTHTVYNDVLDSSLYRSFLDYKVQNLMPALVSGKMMEWAVMHDFLDESNVLDIVNTLFRQYLVLSDPSLQVFTDMPQRLQVTAADAIPGGLINYIVTVNNMGQVTADSLQVTAWFDSAQFVSGWIPQGASSTTLALNSQGADTMILTITGDNVLAYRQGVSVSAAGPYISHISADLNDEGAGNGDHIVNPGETIEWTETVRNIGSESALGVTANLASSTPGVTITQNLITLGTIDTQQTVTSTTPFIFSVAPSDSVGPALQFNVTYSMANGPNQQAPVTFYVHTPNLLLSSAQVVDNNNNFWDRDETVNLQITVSNSGNADLLGATYVLSTQDPLVTIVDGVASAPLIPDSGGTYTIAADSFAVHSSWATPAGHATTLLLTVTADMGTYTYTHQVPINLIIGVVGASDPFADNINRFWVYDNSDTLYTEHPTYEWIEIAPAAGGAGTEIPFTSGDQTYALHLPFSYAYYGVTKDSLSVSTDGWVRPGRTTMTNHSNAVLPNTDNVPGMIAPLWFDLRRPTGEAGEICYYYDATSDRFIVEWYNIHHPGANDSAFETFQVQLLNPATYPTQTGDAIWIFQYQETSPLVNGATGATVGFESPSQANGATYVYHGSYTTGAAIVQAGRAIKLTTEPPAILSATPRQVALPTAVELHANYPNPFNPETTIEFALPRADHVKLSIFNVLGRQVATLMDGPVEAGLHTARWRGMMDNGASATSGVYFYRLETSGQATTRKMILLR